MEQKDLINVKYFFTKFIWKVISTSLDLSIFDPGTSIAAEFYVSLHELMNSLVSRTTLIWSTVDVLQNACRNAAARQALIHTYKFAPILARLLEVYIFIYILNDKWNIIQ